MEWRNRVVDIQSGLYSPQRFWLIWTPPRAVSVFKLGLQVFVGFLCSQNSRRTNKQLIWIFRELVMLLNKLEEEEIWTQYPVV